jgi:hypothetical protein
MSHPLTVNHFQLNSIGWGSLTQPFRSEPWAPHYVFPHADGVQPTRVI